MCSERSSASSAAASSTPTNISETITAIAAAYDAVGVVLPANSVVCTVSGVPIELNVGEAKARPSIARFAKLTTWRRAGSNGESFGSDAIVPWTIVRAFFRPSSGTLSPKNWRSPPLSTRPRSSTATRSTCFEIACST